jgi:CheY-like chemotaxis protein
MAGRILVVDDDAVLRGTVARVLEDEGYDVDEAADGQVALSRIEANRPDAILLDVLMPRMNGKQVLEVLRSNEITAGIPVVVMTTVTGFDVTREAGISDLVEKPFEVDELLDKIALVLYRVQPREPTPDVSSVIEPLPGPDAPAEPHRPHDIEEPESRGVVMVVHRDHDIIAWLDEALGAAGYTTVSLSKLSDELSRLARVLEPRAILVASDTWTDDEVQVLESLHSGSGLDSTPLVVLGEGARLDALRNVATAAVALDQHRDATLRELLAHLR